MANSGVVGVLRALLTADTAEFDKGMRKASQTTQAFTKQTDQLGQRLTGQAARLEKAFGGEKMLAHANSLTAAVTKLGGATKLTHVEQTRVNNTLGQAIAKYQALGQTAPAAMVDLHKATSTLTTKSVALGTALGTVFGMLAVTGLRAMVAFGQEAFRAADNMEDLSKKTGLSIETIQRMQFVAEQTGTTLDAMTQAAFRLGVRLDGGGKSVVAAVEKLGLSWRDLKQQSPDKQFETVVAALGKVESATERNRLGQELFGRSFLNIAGAVADGYDKIGSAASTASAEQVKALARASERWAAFVRNLKTNVTAFLGQMLLMSDAIKEVESEQGRVNPNNGAQRLRNLEEAERRSQLGLLNARKTDIHLTKEAAVAEETYVQKLKAVQAELAKLTPAQRAEIEAAKQLGESTDDLEDKYGLTSGALRILSTQTKGYEKTLKDTTKASDDAAIGERMLEDEARRQKAIDEMREQRLAKWKDFGRDITQSFSQHLADLMVGLRGFKGFWSSLWDSIRQSFSRLLASMLQEFIEGFVNKAAKAAGEKLGGMFGGGGESGGGGGGGFWKTAAKIGKAIFGLFFHDGGVVGGAPGRDVPIIAQSGEAVLTRRATAAIGGKRTIDALNAGSAPMGSSFAMAGFAPMSAVPPPLLSGGSINQSVLSTPNASSIHFHVSTLDSADMDRVFSERILPRLHMEFQLNQRGTGTLMRKVTR